MEKKKKKSKMQEWKEAKRKLDKYYYDKITYPKIKHLFKDK
jgi:hypothetical protein